MKAWLLKDFGLKNLELSETATPVAQAGELLVKVAAVSLNFRDKAAVTLAVKGLEVELGVRLLHRTTRQVHVEANDICSLEF